MMTNKLEMPLEQFAEAVAKENERLVSGPGGIMEMKQTIADKEQLIEKLENQFKLYFHAFNKAASHIEKLEAALRVYANEDHWSGDNFEPIMFPEGECKCCYEHFSDQGEIARKALGGKDE
jgi:hypothetical protein